MNLHATITGKLLLIVETRTDDFKADRLSRIARAVWRCGRLGNSEGWRGMNDGRRRRMTKPD